MRDRYFSQWISDNIDPKKYGLQLAKDFIYGKKQEFKMYGNKRRFYDCQYKGHELINDNIEQTRKDYFKERDKQQKRDAEKLKRTVEKMDFDYYQIKGKWNAATVSRRAEKLEEAEAAADELEAAGADGVEIVGIKAGKRETLRGKRAKRGIGAKIPSNNKKAYKAPKMTVKADKKKPKKTAVKMRGTTGEFVTDYKTEKAAKKAADNIKKLGYKADVIEPAGQIDLFTGDESKKVILKFSERELATLINDYYDLIGSGERLVNYKSLLTTFEKATAREKIELTKKEIKTVIAVLQKYMKKNISDKGISSIYGQTKDLKDSLIKAYYNV